MAPRPSCSGEMSWRIPGLVCCCSCHWTTVTISLLWDTVTWVVFVEAECVVSVRLSSVFMIWCDVVWCVVWLIWYIWCDMIWYMIWYDILYEILYDIWYDMIWYHMTSYDISYDIISYDNDMTWHDGMAWRGAARHDTTRHDTTSVCLISPNTFIVIIWGLAISGIVCLIIVTSYPNFTSHPIVASYSHSFCNSLKSNLKLLVIFASAVWCCLCHTMVLLSHIHAKIPRKFVTQANNTVKSII